MTRLIVVPAAAVGDRPRWWCVSREDAEIQIDSGDVDVGSLHIDSADECSEDDQDFRFAIVADHEAAPRPTPDPREEAFWSAAFMASLGPVAIAVGSMPSDGKGDHDAQAIVAAGCASIADAAIAEWRKRFAAKED